MPRAQDITFNRLYQRYVETYDVHPQIMEDAVARKYKDLRYRAKLSARRANGLPIKYDPASEVYYYGETPTNCPC